MDRQRLSSYVGALPRALQLPADRIVGVLNTAHTKKLYERVDRSSAAGGGCQGVDSHALAELRGLALSRGMKLVDAPRLLEEHYRRHRRLLDFSPVDSHWNAVATAIIAAEIARQIRPSLDKERGLNRTGL